MRFSLDPRKWFATKRTIITEPDATQDALDALEKRRRLRDEGIRKAIAAAHTVMEQTGVATYPKFPLEPYIPPRGVMPEEFARGFAMDQAWTNLAMDDNWLLNSNNGSATANVISGMGFPGFPYLTELTQLTEYRDMSERTASEMTRKWIKLKSTSPDEDNTDYIAGLDEDLKKFRIRELFRECAKLDGFMGRAQLFINMGETEGEELKTPLMLNRFKIQVGTLRGFKLIEPITTYPSAYNATNPLKSDYYVPSMWFVYGSSVHASRFLTFVSRPVPDLLKPVFNFSGISLSQLAQPYVDYWFSTRDSVGKLIRNFSITALSTNLDTVLQTGGDDLTKRMQLFTRYRDNQGVFLLNKAEEALTQLNVPITGLDKLQAQAQEHMAAVAKTPLVILLGITPSGLNTSSESEIKVYYDYIADQQEVLFRPNLEKVLQILQLNRYGRINPDITFEFEPLFTMSDKEAAATRKSDSEVDGLYIDKGVLDPLEIRTRLATSPSSGYNNIQADKVPMPPPQSEFGEEAVPKDAPKNSVTAEVSTEEGDGASDLALSMMDEAARVAQDGGFRGNQHIGGISSAQDPFEQAMRLTSAATAASKRAQTQKTARAHQAAFYAHTRAHKAHKLALSSGPGAPPHVHSTYCDAHEASAAAHKPYAMLNGREA